MADERTKLERRKKLFGKRWGAILGSGADKAGHYTESYGGGTPLKAGEKAPSQQWVEDNRQMQPRDEDGKFTYNAVNFIPLKYKSRGKTESPLLRGAKIPFFKEGQKFKFEGDNVVVSVAKMDFSDQFREFSQELGFGGDIDESLFSKKEGRPSKVEKSSEEGYLGDIELSKIGKTQKEKIMDKFANKTQKVFKRRVEQAGAKELFGPDTTVARKELKNDMVKNIILTINALTKRAMSRGKKKTKETSEMRQASKLFGYGG